jgi:hypothetical protein
MSEINWKSKYQELKLKFMNSVDTAFRLGFEQGMQEAQKQQIAEAQAAQQQAEEAAAQGGQPDQEGAPGEQPQEGEEDAGGDSMHPQGSELDQHISQLESMISKSELKSEDLEGLRKSLDFLKGQKQVVEGKMAKKAINGIVKALNKSTNFSLGKQASANLTPTAKAALTMQEKIVTDIMKSWEQEEAKASQGIKSILAGEGLVKKD